MDSWSTGAASEGGSRRTSTRVVSPRVELSAVAGWHDGPIPMTGGAS
jgi:hypothetical protein